MIFSKKKSKNQIFILEINFYPTLCLTPWTYFFFFFKKSPIKVSARTPRRGWNFKLKFQFQGLWNFKLEIFENPKEICLVLKQILKYAQFFLLWNFNEIKLEISMKFQWNFNKISRQIWNFKIGTMLCFGGQTNILMNLKLHKSLSASDCKYQDPVIKPAYPP